MRSLVFYITKTLLLLFVSVSIFAQDTSEDVPITNLGTISNDGEGVQNTYAFCLNENNELIVKVNVLLGDLDVMGSSPNQYGVIPPDVPEMYIEFTVNGDQYYVPMGNFDIVELDNGFTAFSFIAQSPPIDFSADCNVSAFNGTYVYVNVKYRLVTPSGDGWAVYPACDYSAPGEMFSCYVYSYAPWCGNAAQDNSFDIPTDQGTYCYDEWFSGGYSAKLYCDCEDGGDEPIHDDDRVKFVEDSDDGEIKNRLVESLDISVFPNPMENSLTIETSSDNITGVQLYNSRGALVVNESYTQDKNQNIRLNTAQLPNGLYLVRVATNSGYKVIKVLK